MWDSRSLRYRDGNVDAPGGRSPAGLTRIILLIHGYNNDKAQAEQSYAALSLNVPDEHLRVREQMWKFFWPSYVERITNRAFLTISTRSATAGTESNGIISIPAYAWQVLKARSVGRALGRYLSALKGESNVPTEIVIVAHSLGCRVALEALRELLEGSDEATERQRVPCVCLMAAAVPTFMVEKGARLEVAALLPQTSYILHSRADLVLRFAFPAGQTVASMLRWLPWHSEGQQDGDAREDEGAAPEAVGRHGNPTGLWLRRAETPLGHSEYWQHPSTAPSVLRALGKATTRDLTALRTLDQMKWVLPSYPDLPDWRNRSMDRAHVIASRPAY